MPKKNVREMSALEKRRYSFSTRMFRAVMALDVIIAIAAITFGFYLYTIAINREYRIKTWQLSKTAAMVINQEVLCRKADEILAIYDQLEQTDEQASREEAYREQFSGCVDDQYNRIRLQLRSLAEKNGAVAAYAAALDEKNNRMIFLIDSDPKDSYCPPGSWDLMESRYIDAFLNGSKVNHLDKMLETEELIPSIISRMPQYGYRCTAGSMVYKTRGYTVMVFMDTDMNQAAHASRRFLLEYVLLLLCVSVIVALLMVRHLKKTVVAPVNELAAAAKGYMENRVMPGQRPDEQAGQPPRYFEAINIRTGDEIEELGFAMKDMENSLADYMRHLTNVTAEKERINTELSVAGQIQEGVIPHIYPAFPDRKEFLIYATMHTAKEVGGDFYDFFLIDDDHLAIVMADVSGKGIPAALFMMVSKILIKNAAMSEKVSPAVILEEVNEQLCMDNPAEMFVTVWLGILEISSGVLTAANAGHEFPALKKAGEKFELLKDKHGFVVGGMEGMVWKDYQIRLEPGDLLFQYTDGVTEAESAEKELFGIERMLEALNLEQDTEPESLLHVMLDEIEAFAEDTAQFDDITMLCLKYTGKRI